MVCFNFLNNQQAQQAQQTCVSARAILDISCGSCLLLLTQLAPGSRAGLALCVAG